MYKKYERSAVIYFTLYVDDILLIESDLKALYTIKIQLVNHFDIKDLALRCRVKGSSPQ